MSKTERPDLTLDELLLELQLLSAQHLNEFTALSKKTGLALGKTLVLSHMISEANLEKLLKLQAIYRGCKIPRQMALDAYRCSTTEGLTIEEGLARAGVFAQIISFSRLGLLLVDAKLISKNQLDEAQRLANETRFPLGKTLTMHGAITQEQLSLALELQRLMRERKITKDQALEQLSKTKSGMSPEAIARVESALKTALDTQAVSTSKLPKINLVELLVIAGIITEHDADTAFEVGSSTKQKPEEILKSSNLVPESLLNTALELQESINSGDLNAAAAAETLNYIANYALNQPAG
ncbi:MAG TPA: hypothetical protein V6C89_03380 [Drouetiella sp.]|jgi:hypothetical protein